MNGTSNLRLLVTRKISARGPWFYIGECLIWLLLFSIAAFELLPICWLLSTSLRAAKDTYRLPPDFLPTAWQWSNYLAVLTSTKVNFVLFFFNSLKLALIAVGAQLLTCSLAAYAFSRLRFPGRDFIFLLFLASMMIPGQVTIIPRFVIIRTIGLIDTHWALILPGLTSAFGVFMLRQHFLSLPSELADAAKVDGAGFFRTYWQIMLPLVGPGLSTLGVFTFLASWNSFFEPMLFLRDWNLYTLPFGLVMLAGLHEEGSQPQILAGVMMSIFPLLVVFLLAQSFVIKGVTVTGLKR